MVGGLQPRPASVLVCQRGAHPGAGVFGFSEREGVGGEGGAVEGVAEDLEAGFGGGGGGGGGRRG